MIARPMRRAAFVLAVLMVDGWSAEPVPPPLSSPSQSDRLSATQRRVASHFAALRQAQAEEWAHADRQTVPDQIRTLFRHAERSDWEAMSRLWPVLQTMSGQYTVDVAVPGIEPSKDPGFHAAWPGALEVYGFSEQVSLWDPGLMAIYASEMLTALPHGSILFAGTDAGRFITTAFLVTNTNDQRIVLTQNAFGDNRYLHFAMRLYADRIWLPSQQDSASAFQTYVNNVRRGNAPGIMGINGIIAQMVWDHNKADRGFFVEESSAISWMYPYLEPHRLILKLNPDKLEHLASEVVTADTDYWRELEQKLLSDDAFASSPQARQTFAKCRCAIAGLYEFREMHAEAEKAYQQAIRLDPRNHEAHFRLATVYQEQARRGDARRTIQQLKVVGPDTLSLITTRDRLRQTHGEQKAEEYYKKEVHLFRASVDTFLKKLDDANPRGDERRPPNKPSEGTR
jgi:tetratricopeptide (TPR) repeat protein